MATNKETYQEIATKLSALRTSTTELNSSLVGVDNAQDVEDDFSEIFNHLNAIDTWTNDNIQRIDEETVLNDFLTSLKALMEDYSAKFELGNSQSGYGVSYGEGDVAGMKITVEKDGVVVSKVINKTVITGDDI